jgi:hypothetical protein
MMTLSFRSRLLGLIAGVAVLCALVVTASLRNSHDATAAPGAPAATPAEALPALGRPTTNADTVDPQIANMIAVRSDVDRAGIRSFASTTGTGWLIPHKDRVCVAIPDRTGGFGISCARPSVVVAQGLYILKGDPRQGLEIDGALPEGETADAINADGTATKLQADSYNVVAERLPPNAKSLRFTAADGTSTSNPLPVPPPPAPKPGQVGVVRSPS